MFSKVDLKDLDFSKIPYYPKPPEELQEIVKLLQKSFLCTKLERKDVERIAGAMKPRAFEKGQLIIKYGDVGHEYFVLAQGSVQVMVYQRDADPADPELESKVLFTKVLPKGAGFGEIALMYNDKRTASIKAEEQCKTYVLDGGTFKAIIIKSSIDKRIVQSGFLDKIPLFDSLEKS